jgi:lipopolysaccharide/colanic/teichoic acid biosynthesis glycosyltransferase
MPALAGVAGLVAAHPIAWHLTAHGLFPAGVTAGFVLRWALFGAVSHAAFSFSVLHRCRARSRSMLLLSMLRSCALTTYLLAFYLVRSHRAVSYPAALGTFFALAFVYQALRYKLHVAEIVKHREAVLVLGTGREAQKIWRHLRLDCDQLVEFKGFVCGAADRDAAPDILARTVCSIDLLEQFLHHTAVHTLILAESDGSAFAETARRIARECGSRLLCAHGQEAGAPVLRWLDGGCDGYVEVGRPSVSVRASTAVKALADRVLAASALVMTMPLTLPLLLLYQLVLGESPLVQQTAYGCGRRAFKMWELRTAASRPLPTRGISQMPRPGIATLQAKLLARVGHFLKVSGLARAPRLWNVLAGEMSLVGPRPVLRVQAAIGDAHLPLRRYTMRPGLCWPTPEALQSDDDATLRYLDGWSLALDWKTLTHWARSRAQRTLHAISAPLLPEQTTLTEPTQRTR